ncbi:ATP-grasp domain-containing protein [Treponema sp.]|uniref:ATP-grasp domain-containing protein n=1 Tax=Treponema sp. TaxID=166 RepID=UPI002600BB2B|nr:ATP-grasp domain-containing protein [Treponema sp.]MCR5219150.1 ATP-grasp domain-containing protein [Treponema sp.]
MDKEKDYILILGAGLMQLPSIEAAKELGYKALVIDADPSAVCVHAADRFENIDLKDKEKIAELALSLGSSLKAVFTAGTDFSASVAYAAEKASLPGHSYEACLNASNKVLMRGCFKKNGVSSPEFTKISRGTIAQFLSDGRLDKMEFPKVIKPVDNMGARGCRLIRNKKEFLPSVEEAVRNSKTSCAILEDYMEGPEFSIDALVYDGTFTITGFADRHIYFSPYFIELGHTMPSVIDENKKNELIRTFAQAVKALGLTRGAAKADIKFTQNGPMIGEVAARLSGGYMSGWTYPYASGLNLTKEAMKLSLGLKADELEKLRQPVNIAGDLPFKIYEVPCVKVSAERAWISIPGKVESLINVKKTESLPFVKNVLYRSLPGASVDFPRNNVSKCGNVISLSSSYKLACQGAEDGAASVLLRLKPCCQETDIFLKGFERPDEEGFPYSAFNINDSQKLLLENFALSAPKLNTSSSVYSIFASEFPEDLMNMVDFNHRTLGESLKLFDRYGGVHCELDSRDFCNALIRGGIQGILYLADSKCNSKK